MSRVVKYEVVPEKNVPGHEMMILNLELADGTKISAEFTAEEWNQLWRPTSDYVEFCT